MKDILPAKRHTLILALIRQMRISARDDIAEMFIRRVGMMHRAHAKNSSRSRPASESSARSWSPPCRM
jgi:hypothetical protein